LSATRRGTSARARKFFPDRFGTTGQPLTPAAMRQWRGALLRPLVEILGNSQQILGKSKPACRVLRTASFCRFFPAYHSLPAKPVRIGFIAAHSDH
jgi:hypothetical protein